MKTYFLNGKYASGDVTFEKAHYGNYCLAVIAVLKNGEVLAKISVNFDDLPAPEGHFYFKTYGENEGLYESMLEYGLIEDTGVTYNNGFVEVPLVKCLF